MYTSGRSTAACLYDTMNRSFCSQPRHVWRMRAPRQLPNPQGATAHRLQLFAVGHDQQVVSIDYNVEYNCGAHENKKFSIL